LCGESRCAAAHRALPVPPCATSSLRRPFTFAMTSSKSRRLPRCSHHHRHCPCHRPTHRPKPAPGSISTHTRARDRTSSSGQLYPHEPRTTHRTQHRTATPFMFCSSVPTCHACSSRCELTCRPTPTLPQPVLAHRWCALCIHATHPLSTQPKAPYLRHSTRCIWVWLLAGSVISVGLRSALLLQPRQLGISRVACGTRARG